MSKCNKCNIEHSGSYGSGRFCSQKCAKSRSHTQEHKTRISNKLIEFYQTNKPYMYGKTKEDTIIQLALEKRKQRKEDKISTATHDSEVFMSLSYEDRRRVLSLNQDGKCDICDIKYWLDKPIRLHYDHINGNSYDDSLENSRLICPNCHSQTETYCGKNKNSEHVVIDDADFAEALFNSDSIRQALIRLRLAPKGRNYIRAREIVLKYGITFKTEYYNKGDNYSCL